MTNTTQASGTTKKASKAKEAAAAPTIDAEAVQTSLPTSTGESVATAMQRFGKKTVEAATVAAITAIRRVEGNDHEVERLEGEILLKKEGNSFILHNLAKECVKLTMDGKTAQLKDAADLMAVACEVAEADTVAAARKANNGVEHKIKQLVPSWPVLRSEFISAMRKAKLNPHDFPQPTNVRKAYKEWKEKNPEGVDGRGAKPRTTDKNGTVPQAAKETATQIARLSDGARNAIAALTGAVQRAPEDRQAEVIGWVDELTKRIMSLSPQDEGGDGVKVKTRPNPVATPESNQIAQ